VPSASHEATADLGQSLRGRYLFDDYELDLGRGSLVRGGEEIPLRPKSFAVLQYLLEHAGQLVTRQELMAAVWPDVVVTDDSIAQCLIELRRMLGDDQRRVIRTVPRRGLIFDLPVRFEENASPASAPSRRQLFRLGWPVFVTLAVAAVLLWWSTDLHLPGGGPDDEVTEVAKPESIAVLRFTDLSPGGDQAYLADGISEEIMHILAQSPSLRVIARTSSFAVEGQPVAEIARTLDVTHVLEGSVRKQGDEIRITAQLIDAETSSHLWSRTYDRTLEDILGVQREIANNVAEAFEVVLTDKGVVNHVDPRAYQLFLEARYLHFRGGDGDLLKAKERYEASLKISPEFAPAWTGLSAASGNLLLEKQLREQDPEEYERLQEINRNATMQALRYGPELPEVQMRAARYHYFNGDLARAREHVEAALSIDPDHWLVRSALVNELTYSGQIEDAAELLRSSAQRDPLNMFLRENLVMTLVRARQYEEARVELKKISELVIVQADKPRHLDSQRARTQILTGDFEDAVASAQTLTHDSDRLHLLAIAYQGLNRETESADNLSRLIEVADDKWSALNVAEVFAQRGDIDQALSWLERLDLEPNCDTDNFAPAVYYSPFLAALDGTAEWESYRAGVLQVMRNCLLGLDLAATHPLSMH